MSKTTIQATPWNLAQLWNEVATKDQRPMLPRDYIYAGEIGGAYIDRYYKMKAVPYTNPPNARSLRKFLAGNVWEYVVKLILVACGVYKKEEVKCDATPYPGLLSVHGRMDYKAGGFIFKQPALDAVEELQLPDFLRFIAYRIIDKLAGGFLEERILELKTASTYAMDMVDRRRSAIPQHSLQAYHYQKNAKMLAEVCYICKDDCRMAQFPLDKKECEKLYKKDIEEMTFYYRKNKIPPPAPLAKFDPVIGRFGKNLSVEYSPYLTKIYGFKTPDEYRNSVKYVEKWNRALARFALVEGKKTTPSGMAVKITQKNLDMKAAIIAAGYNFEDCLKCKIAAGVAEEEIES